jgi:hypothetical protein
MVPPSLVDLVRLQYGLVEWKAGASLGHARRLMPGQFVPFIPQPVACRHDWEGQEDSC